MAADWDDVTLGEVAQLSTGFPFSSELYTSDETAPRLLRGDNIAQGRIRWDGAKRWLATRDGPPLDDYWLAAGDVVLAMDRPWIEAGLKYAVVGPSDLPALLVQRVARLRGKERLSTRFLKFVIGSREFTDHVLAIQTGTGVPHISGSQIKEFTFRLPPKEVQNKIEHVLSALDSKIELNQKINETLEAMARLLFKSWFVDFDPVRARAEGRDPGLPSPIASLFPDSFEPSAFGETPEGWVVEPIGAIVEAIGGGTPSTKESRYWAPQKHAWATPKDLSGLRSQVLLNTERAISDTGLAQISSGLLPAGTVLMSSRAPIGYLAVAEVPVAINQGFIAMKPKGDVSNLFLLYWAEAAQELIRSRANGSTFLEISKSSFRQIDLVRPSTPIMKEFDRLVRPWHQRIVMNEQESETLKTIRDTLLPKLISGEIRVKALTD